MKIYQNKTVLEASLDRIRRIFDEFDDVWVSISGGKDSTVVYNLAKIVAKEKNRLPLKVMFLDQEAEWKSTIDVVKRIMYDKDVEPYWFQIPIKLFNATSEKDDWLNCWGEGEEWLREKDPISIKENKWGTDRFHEFFRIFMAEKTEGGKKLVCDLTGMRAEESPNRFTGMTNSATYKDITWGRRNPHSAKSFTFHPIYDWSYLDVWKAIHDHKWDYNKIYDYQYQHGVPVHDMRVSNLHHETAVHSLFILQEVEPDTYNKLTKRIHGIDTAGKLGKGDYYIKDLPFMFKDWKEYRDYLLENLIEDPEKREKMRKKFKYSEDKFLICIDPVKIYRTHIQTILANDYHGTKLDSACSRWNIALKDYKRRIKNDALA